MRREMPTPAPHINSTDTSIAMAAPHPHRKCAAFGSAEEGVRGGACGFLGRDADVNGMQGLRRHCGQLFKDQVRMLLLDRATSVPHHGRLLNEAVGHSYGCALKRTVEVGSHHPRTILPQRAHHGAARGNGKVVRLRLEAVSDWWSDRGHYLAGLVVVVSDELSNCCGLVVIRVLVLSDWWSLWRIGGYCIGLVVITTCTNPSRIPRLGRAHLVKTESESERSHLVHRGTRAVAEPE
ncbi:hypothetical protein M427DRAFT_143063 [Gonapodya prolifera JEL478]|uniref:Uncharacterized protein n=1 Tax=Gonapodya prolifera (strain JEL478) TaxID=1344416 RepID=A0A139ASI4_GONPJ|nr:hypothetical protein M427DRAFT_143063 [Gonapodya prolifera JEL478]|eukprot:KXS19706.1 hypothetical protein M427DRAFT_143063 [Gonapodya prolifera JEL478]